jgi:hypothetical protein
MDKKLYIFHYFSIAIFTCSAIFIFFVAYENLHFGLESKAQARGLLATILLAYSAAQFFAMRKVLFRVANVIAYPVNCLIFIPIWAFASDGHIKGWAPATANEAFKADVIFFVIFTTLFLFATWLLLPKKHHENKI